MRYTIVGIVCALLSVAAFSAVPASTIDPESECRIAIQFLEQAGEDRTYLRFLSMYSVPPQDRAEFSVALKFSFRQCTLTPNRRVFPNRVPGSDTLWWFDLRSFGWNDAAWRAVALRDKTFREPWVHFETAKRLRGLLGELPTSNYQVVGIVDAFQFYRRIYQTVESPDYYDLLFAEQRYPLTKEVEYKNVLRLWPGGRYKDGKDYPKGWYNYREAFPKRGFKDFPKNEEEWLGAFTAGISVKDYQKALQNLLSRKGAVLRGSEDTREGGSYVARHNRLVWVAPALSRIGAIYGETFDVKKTAGKRDLEENAFTDQLRDKGRVFRDGGELLFTLPAGDGLATLLIDGKGNRVEEVPPDIAIHTRDSRDRRVRNGPLACYACHAEFYGWIPLNNVIEQTSPDEVDVRFKDLITGLPDRKAAEDYDAFFIGWGDELKPIRESVKTYWQQTTGTTINRYQDGLTGIQIAHMTLRWKWQYDDPVTLEQACRETGAPEAILRVAASRSTLRRAIDLARKAPIPRETWDEDVFPELMRILPASKERLHP